jgi:hypothetical protein
MRAGLGHFHQGQGQFLLAVLLSAESAIVLAVETMQGRAVKMYLLAGNK